MVLFIYAIRYFRQNNGDIYHNKMKQQQQLSARNFDHHYQNYPHHFTELTHSYHSEIGMQQQDHKQESNKMKSMLDWKHFMFGKYSPRCLTTIDNHQSQSVTTTNHYCSQYHDTSSMLYGRTAQPKQKSGLYQQQEQAKHSLLFSFKVDVGNGAPNSLMTKLDDVDILDHHHENNKQHDVVLPNIISAHVQQHEQQAMNNNGNIRQDQCLNINNYDDYDAELSSDDNQSPMIKSNGPMSRFNRERQNSIYLSLLSPTTNIHHQSQPSSGGQQNSNFDLILN